MRYIFCFLLLGCITTSINATVLNSLEKEMTAVSDTIVPKAFLIGEFEAQFEMLMDQHKILLLSACNNDMGIAFEKWKGMLQAMESHSDAVNYDLKGIKMWLDVFWEEDGRIKHIAYYLKPNSRNVDTDKLSLFFISFINNYQFPLIVGEKFSHYGMASFPTFSKRTEKEVIKPMKSGKIDPSLKDSVNSGTKDDE